MIELVEATKYLRAGKLELAQPLVRSVLKKHPDHVSAIHLLASIQIKEKRYDSADKLLRRCLEIAPDDAPARSTYTILLLRKQEVHEALSQVKLLLTDDPENPRHLFLKANILVRMGDHQSAITLFERILEHYPRRDKVQLSYGHALKAVGRVEEAIAAYRRAIEISPNPGEAYWSLANLKTFPFNDADIAAMRTAIDCDKGGADGQSHLAFALAKALEDRELYDESFAHYQRGNTLRRAQYRYDPPKRSCNTNRHINTCTADFLAKRHGWGCRAADPIFIVGLPRSGSTLLEQILASHSAVDGTGERPDIIAISRKLGRWNRGDPATQYPEILTELSREQCIELGNAYLSSTTVQRKKSAFFIDKMPNNFLHIGLIHLILPNAKIIDVRRHPMAGCFASYKQLFASGQSFSYDLEELGHYYCNYVKVMDHWDDVLPGRVLRVQYEDVVSDCERQIRRLLDYCDLPFEDQCLRFYDSDRAVRTPSSEQVRQPIFTHGLEQWRHYEAHLSPLKEALSPVLQGNLSKHQDTL